jgi:valyl-tRNA synthetase
LEKLSVRVNGWFEGVRVARTLEPAESPLDCTEKKMALAQKYNAAEAEERLARWWAEQGTNHFAPEDTTRPVYAIDTPPPTVSGHLHLGHVYSYSHTDFIARFWRMNGCNVYYPMGFDDNGLPTERLVEKRLGLRATDIGREAFIARCLEVSEEAERDYQDLWQRLGLSVDWRYTYRTIDTLARRTSQLSFVELYRQGLAYRRTAPSIWCPECGTSIAQAELNDLERETRFVTLAFGLEDGTTLPIATTRPELLPACVAIFVHPDDPRFAHLVGRRARVPLFNQWVPILADAHADPEKGTGAVMCCTFGDTTDVEWWYTHHLPLIAAIGRDGRMTEAAGVLAGLPVAEARRTVITHLEQARLVFDVRPALQSVRVHERCDTPVEFIETTQWFVRVLDFKDQLLALGAQVAWYPDHMQARYRHWVENLGWDWCISRQRYFGVPFPVWYCAQCGAVTVADEDQLPVDPLTAQPRGACAQCGGTRFTPEADVMDTWATSSMTPQIAGRRLSDPALYARVFPFVLRPQAHEIIRTWAFDTLVKSYHHFGTLPWTNVMISGWGLAAVGAGKISKSRGGGPAAPLDMIRTHSADALRYWAATGGLGRDHVIDEQKIATGARLVVKLWNVARFSERFLAGYTPVAETPALSPADAWLRARLERLVARVTGHFHAYDYAAALHETESFFWSELADNYLEMAKLRLYNAAGGGVPETGARDTLYRTLLVLVKLLAPVLPYVTEEIYQGLFRAADGAPSVHRAAWPQPDESRISESAEALGDALVSIATTVRRYKSTRNLPLSTALGTLRIGTADKTLAAGLRAAAPDLISVTRAAGVEVHKSAAGEPVDGLDGVTLSIAQEEVYL